MELARGPHHTVLLLLDAIISCSDLVHTCSFLFPGALCLLRVDWEQEEGGCLSVVRLRAAKRTCRSSTVRIAAGGGCCCCWDGGVVEIHCGRVGCRPATGALVSNKLHTAAYSHINRESQGKACICMWCPTVFAMARVESAAIGVVGGIRGLVNRPDTTQSQLVGLGLGLGLYNPLYILHCEVVQTGCSSGMLRCCNSSHQWQSKQEQGGLHCWARTYSQQTRSESRSLVVWLAHHWPRGLWPSDLNHHHQSRAKSWHSLKWRQSRWRKWK